MGILRPVAPAKCLHQPNNLTALLKPGLHERKVNKVRQERIGGDKEVPAGNQDPEGPLCEVRKEVAQGRSVIVCEHRESW